MKILSFFILQILFHFVSAQKKLIFAQAIFRHGARAPSAGFSSSKAAAKFPRGLGELSDQGYENSHKLGILLKKRYVDTGFLDKNLKPSEMLWRSVLVNRCLATAATVGAAMFGDFEKHLHTPIYTASKKTETLLNHNVDTCYREQELLKEMCPGYVHGSYKSWTLFETFIAKCSGITEHPALRKVLFEDLEAYINEYKNGIPLPDYLEEDKEELFKLFTSNSHKYMGIGDFRNENMIRIKFGHILRTLQLNIKEAWECNKNNNNEECKKFKFYSSQDWILLGLLESFGILEFTMRKEMPNYNTMLLFELWEDGNQPFVKVYYKKEEASENLIDVTEKVVNCAGNQEFCNFDKFMDCCSDLWDDGEKACKAKNLKKIRSSIKAAGKNNTTNENDNVRFVGHE